MIQPFATDDETAASTSTPGPDQPTGDSDSEGPGSPPVGVGFLLEKDEEAVAKRVNSYWEDLDGPMSEKLAYWRANRLRRKGVIGVQVVKSNPDVAEWKVWAPPGATKVPPTFNQAARLTRRFKSNLFVDPPIPESTPGTASDQSDPDAAEWETRIMQDITTAPMFNIPELAERAVDKAATYDSGFLRIYVDPKGSGSQPKTIIASEAALSVADALYVNGDGVTPQPKPYVTRYVKDTGELTDDPALAALEWLPGLRAEVLTGVQVRPIPWGAETIEDALGVVIRAPVKIGILRDQYPAVAAMSPEDQWELAGQKPQLPDAGERTPANIEPSAKRARGGIDPDQPPPDDTMVTVTSVYMDARGEYPKGAYVVVGGTKKLLHRQKWSAKINNVEEPLIVPLAHFKGWEEGEVTFYGYHLMHFLGPGNEIRAAAIGGAIEHMDRFNRRKVFYTPNTLYQQKMGPASQGVMVPIQQGTEPKVEDFPEYPAIGMELLQFATGENTDESGLQPIAQGQTDPTVQSGLHAQKIIEQVNIGISDIKRSTEKGITRAWAIAKAYVRAYYTQPQQIRFRGDDQEYKQRAWSASDLSDSKDVRMMKGSFTQLAPSAKLAVAEYMHKLGLIDENQLRTMAAGNIGGLMGLQDDPALLRIRRQITLWESGPPKAQHPSEPLPDEYPGETATEEPQNAEIPEAAPMSDPSVIGSIAPAPVAPQPTPMQIALADIFKPAPNDEEPAIAQIRFRELSRAMCSKKYERQPDEWRAGYDAVYNAARMAAGVGTAKEAAANAQAQQQAEQAKIDAENKAKADLQQQLQAAKDAAELQRQQLEAEHETELEKLRLDSQAAIEQAKLDAQAGGDPELVAQTDLEKKRMEIEQKAQAAAAELNQKYELEKARLEGELALEREKIKAGNKLELKKAAIAANPESASEHITPVKKKIEIQRDKSGRINSATITPEGADDDEPAEATG